MPDTTKHTEDPPKVTHKAAALGDAGASGDAAVHQVLAQLEIAERNDDKDAVKALTAQLHDLGVAL